MVASRAAIMPQLFVLHPAIKNAVQASAYQQKDPPISQIFQFQIFSRFLLLEGMASLRVFVNQVCQISFPGSLNVFSKANLNSVTCGMLLGDVNVFVWTMGSRNNMVKLLRLLLRTAQTISMTLFFSSPHYFLRVQEEAIIHADLFGRFFEADEQEHYTTTSATPRPPAPQAMAVHAAHASLI